MIKCEIIADSVNAANGKRITSWVLKYPRFIHSELLTHRMFSKNSASSRAIPIEKMIQMVIDEPAMPEVWGKNQKGMQAAEELSEKVKTYCFYGANGKEITNNAPDLVSELEGAKRTWLGARDRAVISAKELLRTGAHKQIVNRVLETFFHMTVILTGTEFENFFALRAHPDAQPEFQILAKKMLEAMNASTPVPKKVGEWHIPFGDKIDSIRLEEAYLAYLKANDILHQETPTFIRGLEESKRKIAIARCARVSYLNFEGKDDYSADIALCDRLFGSVPRHLSPTEHVAQAVEKAEQIGNFVGWKQYRKIFQDENLSDSRLKK